jgi:hypothetical protein
MDGHHQYYLILTRVDLLILEEYVIILNRSDELWNKLWKVMASEKPFKV